MDGEMFMYALDKVTEKLLADAPLRYRAGTPEENAFGHAVLSFRSAMMAYAPPPQSATERSAIMDGLLGRTRG